MLLKESTNIPPGSTNLQNPAIRQSAESANLRNPPIRGIRGSRNPQFNKILEMISLTKSNYDKYLWFSNQKGGVIEKLDTRRIWVLGLHSHMLSIINIGISHALYPVS